MIFIISFYSKSSSSVRPGGTIVVPNAFVRGKNSIKKWGRKKIEMELKAKKIDAEKIKYSMAQIDDGVYAVRLEDLLRKKLKSVKDTDPYKRRQKLLVYALQKGYEAEIVNEVLKDVLTD